MGLYFFDVPARQGEREQEALNRFCAAQAVVSIERQLVHAGLESFWAVVVTVRDGAPKSSSGRATTDKSSPKLDYKEVLNPADFAVFSDLRELRKRAAQQEGVAVYAVFTNEQLATMVTQRVTSPAALGAIEGIGEARVGKYGGLFLRHLQGVFAAGEQT